MPELTSGEWNAILSGCPEAHLLQTAPWGDLKAHFGWSAVRVGAVSSSEQPFLGAQILFRKLPLGFSLAYIPKGPVHCQGARLSGQAWRQLLPELDAACRKRRAIFLKVEPDAWQEQADAPPDGFFSSQHAIQPARTLLVDLTGDEEQVLARMKQKTRYNIRLALKKGVLVRRTTDLNTFHSLMQITGGRDHFGVHSQAYYTRVYELFQPRGACELFLAEYETQPLAALMVFVHGQRAWYLYGASSNAHRDLMPTYLLQWEAMRWARSHGCREYDLWGVPDEDEQTLEANLSTRSDGLWGVYRFKRGFGGRLCRSAGPWDRVYLPALYAFYRRWIQLRGV